MKIESLREFSSLAKHGKFASAAKARGVSQSALSKHIAELEAEVGVPLVERRPTMRLTPAGRVLLERTEEIVYLHDKALDECRKTGLTRHERLVIFKSGVPDTASAALMQACGRLSRTCSQLDLGFLPSGSVSLMRALEEGKADLGIFRSFEEDLTEFETRGGIRCRLVTIGTVGAGIWMPPNHPLASKPALAPSDLEGVPVVIPAGDAFETERLTAYSFFKRFGVVPRYSFIEVSSLEELVMGNLESRVQLLLDHTDVTQIMAGTNLVRKDVDPPLLATAYAMFRAEDEARLEKLVSLLADAKA